MNRNNTNHSSLADFRARSNLYVAIASFVLLVPFSIFNLFFQNYTLALGNIAIVASLMFIAWSHYKARAKPLFAFLFLLPAISTVLIITIGIDAYAGAFWSYPAALCFFIILPGRWALAASACIVIVVGFVLSLDQTPIFIIRLVATLSTTCLFAYFFTNQIERSLSRLNQMATIDPLTGLLNRTLLYDILNGMRQQKQTTATPASILVLDLDFFKSINDRYGHHGGDAVLEQTANVIRKTVRSSDQTFRLGGEEFLVVLSETDSSGATRVAENLRGEIEQMELPDQCRVTVSIGVAELQQDQSIDDWIKNADRNLYEAKNRGRNCVVAKAA